MGFKKLYQGKETLMGTKHSVGIESCETKGIEGYRGMKGYAQYKRDRGLAKILVDELAALHGCTLAVCERTQRRRLRGTESRQSGNTAWLLAASHHLLRSNLKAES